MDDWVGCFTYKSEDERVNELSGMLREVKEAENACEMNECVFVCGENVNICSLDNLYVKFYMCYVILVFPVYRYEKLPNMSSRAWKRPRTLPPTTGGIGDGPGPREEPKDRLVPSSRK